MDKLDAKVGPDLFTLRDEPHVIGANGSRYFDNEVWQLNPALSLIRVC